VRRWPSAAGCIVGWDRRATAANPRDPCYHDATDGSIVGVKVSVSLPEDDVEFLDSYAREQGMDSRSAALHKAVGLLRTAQLAGAYEDAWDSWADSGDAREWDAVTADGLGD
jgi:Arc/MetJ-type ribon-helix-helix transcriptional regulator